MKQIKTLLLTTLGALLLTTACSNERAEFNQPQAGDAKLTVNSGINGLRAYDDQWEANDAIGVFAASLNANNVQFTTTDEGASATFTSTTDVMIPFGTEEHTVKAYYPYQALTAGATTLDVTLPNAKPLLYATGTVTNANPNLALNFQHKLAEIKISIDGSALGTDLTAAGTVVLKGVQDKATLTIADGTVAGSGSADLTLLAQGDFNAGKFVVHSFLVPGQSLEDKFIVITAGGKTYTAQLPAGTSTGNIEAGKRYNYSFKLTTGAVQMTLVGSNIGKPSTEDITEGTVDPDASTPATPATQAITFGAGLTQEGGVNVMNVAQAGGTQNVEINVANGQAFTASVNDTWVTLSQPTTRASVSGEGPSNLGVTVAANETTEAREAVVTISSEGQDDVTFTIKQAGKEAAPQTIELTVPTDPIEVAQAGGEATFTYTVTPAETAVEATADSWIDVVADGGTVLYIVETNEATAERTGTITLKAGDVTKTVTVKQAGKQETTPTPAPANNWLFPNNKVGDYFTPGTTSGVTTSLEAGAGRNGSDAIKISGSSKENSYVLELKAPVDFDTQAKRISFWIKGTSNSKSLTFVNKAYNTNRGYSLGSISDAVTLELEGSLDYNGTINATDWIQVTLNLEGTTFLADVTNELFWIKTGKSGEYTDVLISDFEVFY